MAFDYSKLNGRIVEKYGTQLRFSEALGLSESLLSKKLNGNVSFKQNEIQRACELLDIDPNDIPLYFFTLKVQRIEQ